MDSLVIINMLSITLLLKSLKLSWFVGFVNLVATCFNGNEEDLCNLIRFFFAAATKMPRVEIYQKQQNKNTNGENDIKSLMEVHNCLTRHCSLFGGY